MWRLGDLSIGGPVVLGPMSGYTSAAYREFMRPFGVSMAYTEMVSDQGLKYGGRQTMSFLDFRSEGITGVQLFGHVPDDLLSAAEKALEINDSLAFVDINMGCPVPKVNRTGAGSALMKDPALCGDIVRRLKRNLSIPVTVKIRLGWTGSTANFMDVIREVEAAGVDAVCIHPRTRDERYTGKPHYALVEGLRDEMSVPLIISGNIYSLDDAINARRTTGAEAVMLARGGIGNPFLVTQIDRYFRYGERLPNPTVRRQAELCLQLADMLIEENGEDIAMRRMRSFAPHFFSGCYRGKLYRNMLATGITDRQSLVDMLSKIVDKIGDDAIGSDGRCDAQEF